MRFYRFWLLVCVIILIFIPLSLHGLFWFVILSSLNISLSVHCQLTVHWLRRLFGHLLLLFCIFLVAQSYVTQCTLSIRFVIVPHRRLAVCVSASNAYSVLVSFINGIRLRRLICNSLINLSRYWSINACLISPAACTTA